MTGADNLINNIIDQILNPLVGLMFGLALAYFIWGVIQFIAAASSDEKKKKGQQHMLWGLIGLVVMTSVYGIMNIIQNFWMNF